MLFWTFANIANNWRKQLPLPNVQAFFFLLFKPFLFSLLFSLLYSVKGPDGSVSLLQCGSRELNLAGRESKGVRPRVYIPHNTVLTGWCVSQLTPEVSSQLTPVAPSIARTQIVLVFKPSLFLAYWI